MTPASQNKSTQITASKHGARLWRMAVGFGWIGDSKKFDKPATISVYPGDVLIRQARPFKAGIEGMSDNGGFVPVKITPEMVGQTVAISAWVEDKQGTGRASMDQKSFIQMVRSFGGRAGIARNDADVIAILNGEILD